MIKKFFFLIIIVSVISSCGNSGKKEAASAGTGQEGSVKVEFTSLVADPAEYVGKNISVEGKVVHVCTHSGKKLFITGEDPDIRLYIQAGEEMPKFPMELLGSEIVVEGKLTRPAASGSAESSGLHAAEHMGEAGADTCETEKAMAMQPVLSDLMMVYNKHQVVK
ncbi:MAG TPA: hypothetical protein PK106_05685 [Bacteroidales bacterium]|jgi:hypothetical protein|nr:hypothetical protein [Bacteroidales bacterium]